jgi:hypothetical protein
MPFWTPNKERTRSETTTTATALPSRGVGWRGGDVLDTANAHTGTGESAERRLGTGAGGLGAVTTSGPDLNVEGGDAELLAAGSLSQLATNFDMMYFDCTHRRPGLPTWRRRGKTRHGRP